MDQDISHRRFNPLTNKWILCSPHRAKRPWLGQLEKISTEKGVEYDSNCYLCPGNKRVSSTNINPKYTDTYVFSNDFSALLSKEESHFTLANNKETSSVEESLMKIEPVTGKCKVICFSPKHNVTLPQMQISEIVKVIETWQSEYLSLSSDVSIKYIQIFENKGKENELT